MKIIAIANQKGGVGKTTTAINLGYCLTLADKSVLLIDLDPQSNATSGLGLDLEQFYGTYQVLLEGIVNPVSIKRASFHPKLSIMPGSTQLASLENRLSSGALGNQRLKNALAGFQNTYDFILIDCPPSFGALPVNALNAANSVIIPIQCEYFAMEGLSQIVRIINKVKADANPSLFIDGIILTMYDNSLQYNKEVAQEIRNHFGDRIYKTFIPRDVAISEASSFGKPALEYDITSLGTISYVELTREVLGYK